MLSLLLFVARVCMFAPPAVLALVQSVKGCIGITRTSREDWRNSVLNKRHRGLLTSLLNAGRAHAPILAPQLVAPEVRPVANL